MTETSIAELGQATRILLVEDDPSNRLLLQDYLIHQGYQVLSLAEGTHFFQTLAHFQPQVVLLDLKLPNISGYQLLEAVQQQPELEPLPIIVITGFAFQAERQRALQLGARHYLVKPICPERLLTTIAEVVPHTPLYLKST